MKVRAAIKVILRNRVSWTGFVDVHQTAATPHSMIDGPAMNVCGPLEIDTMVHRHPPGGPVELCRQEFACPHASAATTRGSMASKTFSARTGAAVLRLGRLVRGTPVWIKAT